LCVYVFWENELFLKNNLNNNHQEDRNCCWIGFHIFLQYLTLNLYYMYINVYNNFNIIKQILHNGPCLLGNLTFFTELKV
jgi:hypothetical protein